MRKLKIDTGTLCSMRRTEATRERCDGKTHKLLGIVLVTSILGACGAPPDTDVQLATTSDELTLPSSVTLADPPEGRFGQSVAIDGDVAVVVAPQDSGDTVVARVYEHDGTDWTETFDHSWEGTFLPHSRVTIDDGRFAIVRSYSEVEIFVRSAGTWVLEQEINPFLVETVALHGNRIVTGASIGDTVEIWELNTAGRWRRARSFFGTLGNDGAGFAVDIHGDTAVVGSGMGSPSGGSEASVLERVNGAWAHTHTIVNPRWDSQNFRFGASVAVDQHRIVIGDPRQVLNQSRAYVYSRIAAGWGRDATLTPQYETVGAADFGASVDVQDDLVVVGAPSFRSPTNTPQGRAYVFQGDARTWTEKSAEVTTQLHDVAPSDAALFGTSIAVSGDRVIVGAPGHDRGLGTPDAGRTSIYDVNDSRAPREPLGVDFDGDGYADLAVGSPGASGKGIVDVSYGNGHKLTPKLAFSQDETSEGPSQSGSLFGASLAWGNFNDDQYDDLVVGVPGTDVDGATAAGGYHVFMGGTTGVSLTGDVLFTRATTGGAAGANDRLGGAIASGDFDADGYDDLAVSASGDTAHAGGSIDILYGSATGLGTAGQQLIDASTAGLPAMDAGDGLGFALAVGDFNCDSFDDLAMSAPFGDVSGVSGGWVAVIYGSGSGLDPSTTQLFNQDILTADSAEAGDEFGYSLAAGIFYAAPCVDLAIGVPGEDINGKVDAGALHAVYGSPSGLQETPVHFFHQDTPGVAGVSGASDRYAHSLAMSRVNHNRFDDLIIGVPGETLPSAGGAVALMQGWASKGLVVSQNKLVSQINAGTTSTPASTDRFGEAVGGLHRGLVVGGVPGFGSGQGAFITLEYPTTDQLVVKQGLQLNQAAFPAPYNAGTSDAALGLAITGARRPN